MQRLLATNKGNRILFLDVRIPKTDGQRGGDRVHPFVRDQVVETLSYDLIASTRYVYLFLDPLRFLLPTAVSTWPGPPDLEFDFYRGPSLDGLPFGKEIAADYYLYEVTGNTVTSRKYWPHPILLEEAFYGFNIVGFGTGQGSDYKDIIYAIPQSEGAFDIERIRTKGYSIYFEARSIQALKYKVLTAHNQGRLLRSATTLDKEK